jgi:23S rRNA (adenine2503-C2)-methyltransferase
MTDSENTATRVPLLGLSRAQMRAQLEPFIDQGFRADQIYRALTERGVDSWDELTDLGKGLRATLAENFSIALPTVESRHDSRDGTTKFLFRLEDGATIETVDIPDGHRRTLCLSSQAGCALACRFCVTGFWGAGRNLTVGEIVGQVLAAKRHGRAEHESHGLNLVFMGMGEPLLNLENLQPALEILMEQISWRRITVSTAGHVPGLELMATWRKKPRLAISLHAPDDARRDELMPINKKYPIAELLRSLRNFPLPKGERLTFEYLLIDRFNDALADADALARLVAPLNAKINLIPLNPDPVLGPEMRAPNPEQVERFCRRLHERGLLATVRRRRGDDVSAACGQLRSPSREPRGFRRSNLSL